jgi:hypothetical protein
MTGVKDSVRESGLERKGARHGGGYSVHTGIAGTVTAGTITALFTVMAGRVFGVLVIPGLLMFRRGTVVGLHLCAVRLGVRANSCIGCQCEGAPQGGDRQGKGDDKQNQFVATCVH